MRIVATYFALYKECLFKALAGTLQNPWTFLLPIALSLAAVFLGMLLGPLGLLGSILFMFALDALLSAYLYFICQIVEGGRASPSEWKASLGRYFWAIVNCFFIIWLGLVLLRLLFGGLAEWKAIALGAQALCFVAFNAVPETLYIKGTHGSLETVLQSFKFMQENWVAWLLPNVCLGLCAWYFLQWHPLPIYGMAMVLGLCLHLFMVFRGALFIALNKSTHHRRLRHWSP